MMTKAAELSDRVASSGAVELAFDHIGIVTGDIDEGARTMALTLGGGKFTKRFDDAGLGVSVRFLLDGSGTVFEFIAPLGEKSPVAKTLSSGKNLLNQIAYRTSSLSRGASFMRENGNLPLGKAHGAIAFGGAPVQFFWSPLGFVIELIEGRERVHLFTEELC